MTYTVIGYAGTRAFRLLWMMEELGLPYQHDPVMPFTDAARLRAPGGRLPALALPDGTVLVDSTAILTYLADRHQSLTYPPGTIERARQDAWIWRCADTLDIPLMALAILSREGRVNIPDVVLQRLLLRIQGGLADLDGALGRRTAAPWLMGASFTIADIVLGHCLHWAERSEHELTRFSHLRSYLGAIAGRSAYVAADSA